MMTKEEFLRLRELKERRQKPKIEIKIDAYSRETFLAEIQTYEDGVHPQHYWLGYELKFPERKVVGYRVTEALVEIMYYETEGEAGMEGQFS